MKQPQNWIETKPNARHRIIQLLIGLVGSSLEFSLSFGLVYKYLYIFESLYKMLVVRRLISAVCLLYEWIIFGLFAGSRCYSSISLGFKSFTFGWRLAAHRAAFRFQLLSMILRCKDLTHIFRIFNVFFEKKIMSFDGMEISLLNEEKDLPWLIVLVFNLNYVIIIICWASSEY